MRAALFRPLERHFFLRVARILTTSPNYAAGSAFLRRYAKRQEVVPMGLDLEPYLHPSDEHRRSAARLRAEHRPLWFYCGRLVYYKGLNVALRALQSIPGTLAIVGSGPELDALTAQARAEGVSDRVQFLGGIPHLETVPYFSAATAFWFPSNARSEAFGLVQVEAMAAGCPVINTDIPHSGISWVSQHERTGLTIPINDSDALAAASRRLLDNPGLREKLSAQARERAQNEFDHRVMAQRCVKVYESVLSRRA